MSRFYKKFSQKSYTEQRRLGPGRTQTERQRRLLRKLLKEARKAADLDQAETAALIGADQSFISKIECGNRQIEFVELERLAHVYRKSITFFETIGRLEETKEHWRKVRQRLKSRR
jgi:transcriptional regulator with XRE-family HTH domain